MEYIDDEEELTIEKLMELRDVCEKDNEDVNETIKNKLSTCALKIGSYGIEGVTIAIILSLNSKEKIGIACLQILIMGIVLECARKKLIDKEVNDELLVDLLLDKDTLEMEMISIDDDLEIKMKEDNFQKTI